VAEPHHIKLQYGDSSLWHRRRSARRVILMCFAILLGGALLRWGYQISLRIQTNHLFRQCMTDVPQSGWMPYEETGNQQTARVNLIWINFYNGWSGVSPTSYGTIFLHGCATPAGKTRLVAVDISGVRQMSRDLAVIYRVFEPPVWLAPAKMVSTAGIVVEVNDPGYPLVIQPGVPDAKLAAHFTIPYVAAGQPGILDGWLKDDDSIVIENRRESSAPTTPPAPASRGSSP